jgi:uncharacterized protein GlcG (DUF336 family)
LNLPPAFFRNIICAVKQRLLAWTFGLCLAAFPASAQLLPGDVQTIIAQAVTRANVISRTSVIAVVDREGFVLGVWRMMPTNSPPSAADNKVMADAICKAGTASFLSSDQQALSSRTAGFIVQQNFPPGLANSGPGPLVGVNFSNLQFSDINRLKGPGSFISTNSSSPADPAGTNIVTVPTPVTGGLAGTPGGVPLYKNGKLVGGIGVAHDGDDPFAVQVNQIATLDEDVALAGEIGFAPAPVFYGNNVTINGFRLAYVSSGTSLGAVIPFGSLPGAVVPPYNIMGAPTNFTYPTIFLGNQTNEIRQPIMDDPLPGLINGQARLTSNEVAGILGLAADRARTTRAGIRLPRGQPAQVFITVVNNPNVPGGKPTVLGTIRTPGATMFSWDVAVQKARTALFFSSSNYAFSVRAVGFLAQELYPPGINGTEPGLFYGMQERFCLADPTLVNPLPIAPVTNTLNGVVVTSISPVDPNLPNGITIFPGGFPLYRNGVVIGAIGVSGDGVDQDDLISASGTANFLAPVPIRTDQFFYSNARLPYAKFPRNPAL